MVESRLPGADKLAAFFQSAERQITPEMTEILEVVATSGKVWHDWSHLKALISVQMDGVLDTYNKSRLGGVEVGPPRPLLGGESLEGLQKRLHSLLEGISGPPFTIQRLCEVLLWPHETYTSIDKLALAIEKLLMVTQTVPRSSDTYPPLPLPPHQPPPPRRPHPQRIQPRLSFGHQPHPEANPDQVEEHELNLHQNHQTHPHVALHRGETEGATATSSFPGAQQHGGGKATPSFLEPDGQQQGGEAKPLVNGGEGFGGGESRPPFVDDGYLLESVPGKGEARKRSFEEAIEADGGNEHQAGETLHVVDEEAFHGLPTMRTDNMDGEVLENGAVEDPVQHGAHARSSMMVDDLPQGNFEAVVTPESHELERSTDVHMDEGPPTVDVVALPAAQNPSQEPSIEPMTPPSIKDTSLVSRSDPEVSKEGIGEENNRFGSLVDNVVGSPNVTERESKSWEIEMSRGRAQEPTERTTDVGEPLVDDPMRMEEG